MTTDTRFLNKLVYDFSKRAGEIALSLIGSADQREKADRTLVTEADSRISELAVEMFAPVCGDRYVITEERIDDVGPVLRDEARRERPELMVVIDPIDGTRNYANGMPLYGVSVGVLRDLRPWIGYVVFPGLREMVCCDGDASFHVANPFSADESVRRLSAVRGGVHRNSVFFGDDRFPAGFRWNYATCMMMIPNCSVVNLTWPALGRGCGALFGSHIWDLAGSWPVFRGAGLELRALSDGRVLGEFDADDYNGKWELKEHFILSSGGDYEVLRGSVQRLNE